jgi:hypothetical protein
MHHERDAPSPKQWPTKLYCRSLDDHCIGAGILPQQTVGAWTPRDRELECGTVPGAFSGHHPHAMAKPDQSSRQQPRHGFHTADMRVETLADQKDFQFAICDSTADSLLDCR